MARSCLLPLYLAQIETEVRSKHTLPLLALLACFGLSNVLNAQYFRNSSYWKTHRKEITVGIGVTNFLGELGGRNQIGSPFV